MGCLVFFRAFKSGIVSILFNKWKPQVSSGCWLICCTYSAQNDKLLEKQSEMQMTKLKLLALFILAFLIDVSVNLLLRSI
jgi:hypothetical protein